MMWTSNTALRQVDGIAGPDRDFAASVIEGLSKPRKSLSCRFFYDARGSELFEEITRLPEYYPTRTEIAILDAHAAEIASRVDDGAVLVEFGSGSSRKTEILLAALPRLRAYVPIDVSESALEEAKRRLIKRFPALAVRPIAGDFSRLLALPPDLAKARKLGFFPGSTIGNFSPFAARTLLGAMRRLLTPDGWLIVGVDLKKDAGQLVRAYNDAAGVTAAFNLNLLGRMNRELGADFDLRKFEHQTRWNEAERRIEMHLGSRIDQSIFIAEADLRVSFRAGETIWTESSHKFHGHEMFEIADQTGFRVKSQWVDPEWPFVESLWMVR